ncbi:UNVERIFIED_CONTAM: hypothetical protein HDU68_006470, partial [Siphonaria sp. JEL0065]
IYRVSANNALKAGESKGPAISGGKAIVLDSATTAANFPKMVNNRTDFEISFTNPDEGFAIYPKTDCPHAKTEGIKRLNAQELQGFVDLAKHNSCESEGCQTANAENWICLQCSFVGCSRYMSSHLANHNVAHPIAVSFSDLSVYCYSCEYYIQAREAMPAVDALHVGKFGEHHPMAKQLIQQQNQPTTHSSSSSSSSFTIEQPLEFVIIEEKQKPNYPRFTNVVILTGAGISKESGLNTFRDAGGIWENHRAEEVATPKAFAKDPAMVQRFYNHRREKVIEAEPNIAHDSLAELEAGLKTRGVQFLLVTQNVDDLHERSGSENLIHMHGEICKSRCTKSKKVFSWHENISEDSKCECCGLVGTLRPHVVWFGELPLRMPEINTALRQADLFVSIGTSGLVYPAAGFVAEVPDSAVTIEVNFEATAVSDAFKERRVGPATVSVPQLVEDILAACD